MLFWPSGFAPRASAGFVVALLVVMVSTFVWVGMRIHEDGERRNATFEAIRESWTGAELVRICAGGERVYRLNGRLVTGAYGWSHPLQFAADVTPEAACVR